MLDNMSIDSTVPVAFGGSLLETSGASDAVNDANNFLDGNRGFSNAHTPPELQDQLAFSNQQYGFGTGVDGFLDTTAMPSAFSEEYLGESVDKQNNAMYPVESMGLKNGSMEIQGGNGTQALFHDELYHVPKEDQLSQLLDKNSGVASTDMAKIFVGMLGGDHDYFSQKRFLGVLSKTPQTTLMFILDELRAIETICKWLTAARRDEQFEVLKLSLKVLERATITVKILKDYGIGKVVNKITRVKDAETSQIASVLVGKWRKMASMNRKRKAASAGPTAKRFKRTTALVDDAEITDLNRHKSVGSRHVAKPMSVDELKKQKFANKLRKEEDARKRKLQTTTTNISVVQRIPMNDSSRVPISKKEDAMDVETDASIFPDEPKEPEVQISKKTGKIKRHICWAPDDKLEKIKYFDKDSSIVPLSSYKDAAKRERANERNMVQIKHENDWNKRRSEFKPTMKFYQPPAIDFSPVEKDLQLPAQYDVSKEEREVQFEREKGVMMAVYLKEENIPRSPKPIPSEEFGRQYDDRTIIQVPSEDEDTKRSVAPVQNQNNGSQQPQQSFDPQVLSSLLSVLQGFNNPGAVQPNLGIGVQGGFQGASQANNGMGGVHPPNQGKTQNFATNNNNFQGGNNFNTGMQNNFGSQGDQRRNNQPFGGGSQPLFPSQAQNNNSNRQGYFNNQNNAPYNNQQNRNFQQQNQNQGRFNNGNNQRGGRFPRGGRQGYVAGNNDRNNFGGNQGNQGRRGGNQGFQGRNQNHNNNRGGFQQGKNQGYNSNNGRGGSQGGGFNNNNNRQGGGFGQSGFNNQNHSNNGQFQGNQNRGGYNNNNGGGNRQGFGGDNNNNRGGNNNNQRFQGGQNYRGGNNNGRQGGGFNNNNRGGFQGQKPWQGRQQFRGSRGRGSGKRRGYKAPPDS